MSELPEACLWEKRWRLPDGFKSKKEFRIYLGKSDYVIITDEHYSKKNGRHCDVFQYAQDGRIGKKFHCKTSDDFGRQFISAMMSFKL